VQAGLQGLHLRHRGKQLLALRRELHLLVMYDVLRHTLRGLHLRHHGLQLLQLRHAKLHLLLHHGFEALRRRRRRRRDLNLRLDVRACWVVC
jgi:hypothetical protein